MGLMMESESKWRVGWVVHIYDGLLSYITWITHPHMMPPLSPWVRHLPFQAILVLQIPMSLLSVLLHPLNDDDDDQPPM